MKKKVRETNNYRKPLKLIKLNSPKKKLKEVEASKRQISRPVLTYDLFQESLFLRQHKFNISKWWFLSTIVA